LGHRALIFQTGKDAPGAIKMLVCFFASVDLEIDHSEIVLDIRAITSVVCQFKVIACGGVFN